VLALIARRRHEPAARGAPGRLRRADLEPRGWARRTEPTAREVEHARLDARGGPARLGDPAPRAVAARAGLGHPDAVERAIGGRRAAPQAAVPPGERILEEPDRRARLALVRVGVTPRPDQAVARRAESREQARDRVRVRVG